MYYFHIKHIIAVIFHYIYSICVYYNRSDLEISNSNKRKE